MIYVMLKLQKRESCSFADFIKFIGKFKIRKNAKEYKYYPM